MSLPVINIARASTALVAVLLIAPTWTRASGDTGCLECHAGSSAWLELAGGGRVSVSVDEAAFRASVHGAALGCTDCHAERGGYPHRSGGEPPTRRGIVRAANAGCVACHDETAAQYAEGIHGRRFASGDDDAPACSDCHGAHAIRPAAGMALGSPETCGGCHADRMRMSRHGLSATVVETWGQDFHGMAATLQRKHGLRAGAPHAATCVDCHGAHRVLPRNDPASPVADANRADTCRRCHAGADEKFQTAWLGHQPPTWKSAALVRGVQLFYRVMIPFMVAGLVLQILLHVWRMAVKR